MEIPVGSGLSVGSRSCEEIPHRRCIDLQGRQAGWVRRLRLPLVDPAWLMVDARTRGPLFGIIPVALGPVMRRTGSTRRSRLCGACPGLVHRALLLVDHVVVALRHGFTWAASKSEEKTTCMEGHSSLGRPKRAINVFRTGIGAPAKSSFGLVARANGVARGTFIRGVWVFDAARSESFDESIFVCAPACCRSRRHGAKPAARIPAAGASRLEVEATAIKSCHRPSHSLSGGLRESVPEACGSASGGTRGTCRKGETLTPSRGSGHRSTFEGQGPSRVTSIRYLSAVRFMVARRVARCKAARRDEPRGSPPKRSKILVRRLCSV